MREHRAAAFHGRPPALQGPFRQLGTWLPGSRGCLVTFSDSPPGPFCPASPVTAWCLPPVMPPRGSHFPPRTREILSRPSAGTGRELGRQELWSPEGSVYAAARGTSPKVLWPVGLLQHVPPQGSRGSRGRDAVCLRAAHQGPCSARVHSSARSLGPQISSQCLPTDGS